MQTLQKGVDIMKVLLFLPREYKNLLLLGMRLISALDTAEERKAAIDKGLAMLKDGTITPPEWTSFGKTLGIFKIGKS